MAEQVKVPTTTNEKSATLISEPSVHDASQDEDADKDEDYILTGPKLYTILFSLSLAVFLMALDMSILTTAIPLITGKFQSTTDIGWYISAYTLSTSAFQPLSGKLYANFSMKWTFLYLFFIFEIGSAISGAATSSEMLIVGRFVAGVGAAGIMSGALLIVATVVTVRLRALYTSIMTANFSIALICGPLLGGAFTQHVSWRWVFYISKWSQEPVPYLPLGAVTIVLLVFLFSPPTRAVENKPTKEKIQRLDLLGVIIFVPAIFMILLALQWGGIKYAWNSAMTIGLIVGGVVALVFFAIYQWYKGDMAMIPPSILMNRTVLFASLSAMFGMAAQNLLGLWLPEWFQIVKEASPVQSGVNMLPAMIAQTFSTVVAGSLTSWLGYYNPFVLLGCVFLCIGSGLYTTMAVDTSSAHWIGYQIVFGIGGGMFVVGPLIAVQSTLSPRDMAVGIATVVFFQLFGGSLFAVVSQTIFNKQFVKALMEYGPDVDLQALLAAGTVGFHKVIKPEQTAGVVLAYNDAILDTFYLGVAITAIAFLFALGLPWISVKGKKPGIGAA